MKYHWSFCLGTFMNGAAASILTIAHSRPVLGAAIGFANAANDLLHLVPSTPRSWVFIDDSKRRVLQRQRLRLRDQGSSNLFSFSLFRQQSLGVISLLFSNAIGHRSPLSRVR